MAVRPPKRLAILAEGCHLNSKPTTTVTAACSMEYLRSFEKRSGGGGEASGRSSLFGGLQGCETSSGA